jgi:hypothetical protein
VHDSVGALRVASAKRDVLPGKLVEHDEIRRIVQISARDVPDSLPKAIRAGTYV